MGSILVGIDGSDRGRRALDWAVRFARVVGCDVHMLAVIDEAIANKAGVGVETITDTVTAVLEKKRQAALESYPDMRIQASVSVGDIVGVLADSAAMHDLIVLGSHHGHTIGETISGAKGLRVSVSTSVPTVVVPADWDAKQQGTGIVVGVGPDEAVSVRAIDFAARAAVATQQPLELVSVWGVPAWLERTAESMGGGLAPVGEQRQIELDRQIGRLAFEYPALQVTGRTVEDSSPSRALIEAGREASMLVMGTNSRNALGRTLFGSVTHSVLLNLKVPTIIVPQA